MKAFKYILIGALTVILMGAATFQVYYEVTIDDATHAMTIIDYEHHEVHEGDHFTAHYTNDVTNTNEMTVIGFTTGTKPIHMVGIATASAAASFKLVSAPSIDVNEGTDLVAYNNNRSSATTTTLVSIEDPAVVGNLTSYNETQAASANITTTVTLFHEDIGQTGNPLSVSGGLSRGQSEWLLAASTQYCFILDADDDNDNTHNITLEWYEHTAIE